MSFWVGGNFNLPDTDWSLKDIVKHHYCKEITEVFLESLHVINAEQIVDFSTKGDNTLNLLLTNRVSLLSKCCNIPGLGGHQSAILAGIKCHPKKSRSCETQFITLVNDIAKSLNDGGQLDAALLDFSKAFDKVTESSVLNLNFMALEVNY